MQILKEEVKNAIINAAVGEFLEHGFEKASMRTIAGKADLTVGNVYRYFKNKKELFSTIVAPVIRDFTLIMQKHNDEDHFQTKIEEVSDVNITEAIIPFCDLFYFYRKPILILMYGSKGTQYEQTRELLINFGTEHVMEHFDEMYTEEKPETLPLVAQSISKGFFEGMLEIITHTETRAELEEAIREFFKLFIMGFGQHIMDE